MSSSAKGLLFIYKLLNNLFGAFLSDELHLSNGLKMSCEIFLIQFICSVDLIISNLSLCTAHVNFRICLGFVIKFSLIFYFILFYFILFFYF